MKFGVAKRSRNTGREWRGYLAVGGDYGRQIHFQASRQADRLQFPAQQGRRVHKRLGHGLAYAGGEIRIERRSHQHHHSERQRLPTWRRDKSGDTRTAFDPPIEIDNTVLTDDSTLLITAYIENRGHDDTLSKALAVVGTVIGVLGLVVGGLGSLNKVAIAVSEGKWEVAIGAFIDGFDALATTLGLMAPNCDGPVFGPANVPFVQDTKSLLTAVNNQVNIPIALPAMTDSPNCPSECGHNPQTALSVRRQMI
jgi:hypothetical protein